MNKRLVSMVLAVMFSVVFLVFPVSGAHVIVGGERVEYLNDLMHINLVLPVIYNTGDWLQDEYLNALIKEEYFDFANKTAVLAKETYKLICEDENSHFWPFEAYASFETKCNQADVLSLVSKFYSFTGGAHGLTRQASINWDIGLGKEFALTDLGNPDYYRIILDEINRQMELEPDLYFPNSMPVEFFNETDFYFSEEGVVVFYQLYEIACYACGIREFLIPWELLTENN